jgi:hypothetical protein
MAFIKLVAVGFVGLTVIYWSISLYARSVTKERLEKDFDVDHPEGDKAARDAFVADGLKDYDSSLRPKLIGLVYVVPAIVVGTIIYTINAG